jgi:uncharacterized protein
MSLLNKNLNYDAQFHALYRYAFLWMMLGLAITAGVGAFVFNGPYLELAKKSWMVVVVIIAEVIIVSFLNDWVSRVKSTLVIGLLFVFYAVTIGIAFSVIVLLFKEFSIVSAALSVAGMFGTMAIWTLIFRQDLSKVKNYPTMLIIGIVSTIIVNILMSANVYEVLVSLAGILIFTGATAAQITRTQKLTKEYPINIKTGLRGALYLYLDFINFFTTMGEIVRRNPKQRKIW